jgi:tetratricopeptide (TPR) repeat protein
MSCLFVNRGITAGLILLWALSLGAAETTNETHGFEARLNDYQDRLRRDPTNAAILFEVADFCFDHGARENRKAVDLAESYFRRLLDLNPSNSLARVMLGSTLTMQGRDAFWPTAKMRWVREGLREMDAAVAQDPRNPRIRFERAVNNVYMPKFMQREEIVKNDLELLWRQADAKPANLDLSLRQNIALYYGIFLKKSRLLEDAEMVWKKGLDLAPSSEAGREIQRNLRGPVSAEERIAPLLRR